MSRFVILFAASFALANTHVSAALGETNEEVAAREAYAAGTASFQAGDFNAAAQSFARADSLSPHPVALRWALLAAVKAGDAVLGMTLVDRARGRGGDSALDEAKAQTEAAFSTRVGTLTLRCAPTESCAASVDGKPVAVAQPAYHLTGAHVVRIDGPRDVLQRTITLEAGQPLEIAEETAPEVLAPKHSVPPSVEPAPRIDPIGRASPAYFFVTLAATAALGGATIWSGIDTTHRHDAYLADRTTRLYDVGRNAQARTNILIGVTAGGAATTVVLGIFTRWKDAPGRRPAPTSALGGK